MRQMIFLLALVSAFGMAWADTVAQIKQEISTPSSAGGSAKAGPYALVATAAGQPSPPNEARAGRYSLFSGYLFTLAETTGNRPPVLITAIANQTLVVGGPPLTRTLREIFSDPDGDALTFSTSSSNSNTAEASIIDSTLNVIPFGIGTATITINAFDGKGGLRSTSFIVTVIPNQITEPVTNEPPRLGAPVTLVITPPQNFQPTIRQLFYRTGGKRNYQMLDLTAVGSQIEGTIPAATDSEMIRGIEYYILLSDGQAVVTFPATNPQESPAILRVQVPQLNFQLALQPRIHKMISVPLVLTTADIDAVLLDDYGKYDVLPRQWRIFRFENNDYAEHENIAAQFTPGNAFWLITRSGEVFDIENGLSVNSAQPAIITLQPGFNQIGNPFAFVVAWADIIASGNVQPPVFFDGVQYIFNQTTLLPFEGYFVFNQETVPVTLTVPPIETLGVALPVGSKVIASENDFIIKLTAAIPGTRFIDTENYFGFLEEATAGLDQHDFLEPPPIGEFVRASIAEDEKIYAGNFKPLNQNGQEWDVEITSTLLNQQVHITLLETGQLPAGFQHYVLDKDLLTIIPVNENSFTLKIDDTYPVRHLKVILGSKEFAEGNGDRIPLVPLKFALEQNYPNPFNPETTIRYQINQPGHVQLEIYNLLGQKIRALVNEVQPAGAHSTNWDGLDDAGRSVSSGVYVYRLRTNRSVASRKLVLLR